MSPRARTIFCFALTALASLSARAQVVEANRGVVGALEVHAPAGGLRARAQEPGAPVLVRVRDKGEGVFRVEFLGLRSGEYDLAALLERADGRTAEIRGLHVRIVSQLPPGAGTDVFGLRAPAVTLGAYYREFMWAFAACWAAVPILVIARRLLRRTHVATQRPPAPEPTPGELLLELARAGRSRALSTAEQGRLELLLLRCVRAGVSAGATTRDLARAVTQARREGPWHDLVLEVERWLHAGAPEGASQSTPPPRIEDAARTVMASSHAAVPKGGPP